MNCSKNIICIILFLVSQIAVSIAQTGEWTWINGSNTPGQSGVYGIQGVPAPLNTPPASSAATAWTDKQGNFWLFGGFDLVGNLSSDLWKYDLVTNMWTWIKGPGTGNQPGIYGVQGVSAPANNPGGRMYGSSWVDTSGNLWLFGGSSYLATGGGGCLNDLWKYDITLNEWVWMKGSNMTGGIPAGTYGSQGTPAPANTPGGRFETNAAWVDDSNNLWIFGGTVFFPNTALLWDISNDLWKYNIATNEWAWMKGSNTGGQSGVYGIKGVSDPNNTPGGRKISTKWKDQQGNFWLFGGKTRVSTMPLLPMSHVNDLWKYNPNINEWTWMSGADTIDGPAVRGTKGVPSVNNIPNARVENSACWTDAYGNFWTFGGWGYYDTSNLGPLNDLWHYNPTTNEWTWVSGDSTANSFGVYGTKTVSDPANVPGARSGSVGWMGKDCNIWLFGGSNFNDLWRYIPERPVAAAFTATPDTGCAPLMVNFNNNSSVNCNEIKSYLWNFGDPASGVNDTTSIENPSHQFENPGTYHIKLVVTSYTGGKDSVTKQIIVEGLSIGLGNDTSLSCANPSLILDAGEEGDFYEWSTGETSQSITVTSEGIYWVKVNDGFCDAVDSINISVNTQSNSTFNDSLISNILTPNGDGYNDKLNFPLEGLTDIKIYNRWGVEVYSDTNKLWGGMYNEKEVPEGIYYLVMQYETDCINFTKTQFVHLIR